MACSSTGPEPGAPRVYYHLVPPETTYDLTQGRPLAEGTLGARLAGTRLIFVGEHHDEPRSHEFQAEVVRALLAGGRPVIVALEMFPPDADDALRAWSEGRIDEQMFLKQSRWYENWGFPWAYYRELFVLFRERRLPLRGINVTKKQRRAARRGELPPALREELEALDLALAPHRDYLLDALTRFGHGKGLTADSPKFLTYQRVQVLWDQVMGLRAARLAAEAARERGADAAVVVLIGSGHLAYKLGANLRAARVEPTQPQLTVLDRVVRTDELDEAGRYPLAVGIADLARIYCADPGAPRVPSLSALKLEDDADGVRVTRVRRFGHTPLQVFRKGDVIVSLNGVPMDKAVALRLAYESLPAKGAAEIVVRRDGETVTLTLPLGPDRS